MNHEDDDQNWKSRALAAAVYSYEKPETKSEGCVICLRDEVVDPCTVQPCGHRLGCWECVLKGINLLGHCWLCRTKVLSLICERTGEVVPSDHLGRESQNAAPDHDVPAEAIAITTNLERQQIEQRQAVYRHAMYSKHIGSTRRTGYRELTPQDFLRDPSLVSRARMFIRRELHVFTLQQPSRSICRAARANMARRRAQNAEFLLEYIIAILKTVDMMGWAGEAEKMIGEYLGRQHAKLFLHELRSWLRSPYQRLDEWDAVVQYARHAPEEVSRKEALGEDAEEVPFGADGDGKPYVSRRAREGDCYRPRYSDRKAGRPGRSK
ncbi:uncharacterized protein F5Z01DRAFT_664066 [Emericellopsis atlantica]|uniref:RING-type E3 ubiquitin transferase n=1 Tax=Emericellopsis atlantica TaxID=2614577 RepID=A0A9P7ZGP5_9HYPO|nr:uncharacterized protein F5Z01DRAFT_664066 [Emericellopsis atlantica]KAG9251133.1 hypothetical protein F5Z01DRAFT_664066 [Emericellopsis atlantica]